MNFVTKKLTEDVSIYSGKKQFVIRFSKNAKLQIFKKYTNVVYAVDGDRLYFKEAQDGFSVNGNSVINLTVNKHHKLQRFVGKHALNYDEENKLYYINRED